MLHNAIGAALAAAFVLPVYAAEKVLHTFSAAHHAGPNSGLVFAQGAYYGVTSTEIYRLGTDGSVSTVHTFTTSEGSAPQGLTLGADGELYGILSLSPSGCGNFYRLEADGSITILNAFDCTAFDVANGPLILLPDGTFADVGTGGPTAPSGAIFKLTTAGALSVLYAFTGNSDGYSPTYGLAEDSSGNLYGVTSGGGSLHNGVLFEYTVAGALNVLHTFAAGADGAPAGPPAVGHDGSVYGPSVAANGDPDLPDGAIYKVTAQGAYSQIHVFNGTDGNLPEQINVGADGSLYLATELGGPGGRGNLLLLSAAGELTDLHDFQANDPSNPVGSFYVGSDDTLIGAAYGNAPAGDLGGLYSLNSAGAFQTLYSFNTPGGTQPNAPPVRGPGGHFYVTTNDGGPGAVLSFDSSGNVSTVYALNGANGGRPAGGLSQGADGSLYGVTQYGGPDNLGTLFKISPSGAASNLYNFAAGAPNTPSVAPLAASNGNLYGAASMALYSLNSAATLTSLGPAPGFVFSLLFNPAGLLEGTAVDEGLPSNPNEIFTSTTAGTVTVLHTLTPAEGGGSSYIMQTADGTTYGTATSGGANNFGTLFKLNTDTTVTVLHSFTGTDGAAPGQLLLASDGNLYGVAGSGGASNAGTVFEYDLTKQALSTVYAFAGVDTNDGFTPVGIVQGSDGNFYGATAEGGPTNEGTLFEVDGPSPSSSGGGGSGGGGGATDPALLIGLLALAALRARSLHR